MVSIWACLRRNLWLGLDVFYESTCLYLLALLNLTNGLNTYLCKLSVQASTILIILRRFMDCKWMASIWAYLRRTFYLGFNVFYESTGWYLFGFLNLMNGLNTYYCNQSVQASTILMTMWRFIDCKWIVSIMAIYLGCISMMREILNSVQPCEAKNFFWDIWCISAELRMLLYITELITALARANMIIPGSLLCISGFNGVMRWQTCLYVLTYGYV